VISVLGRFLEHERVYVFGPDGEEEFFLASADWMPRNFDRRVEVLFPIESGRLRERIRREVIAPAMAHEGRAYVMDANGVYAAPAAPAVRGARPVPRTSFDSGRMRIAHAVEIQMNGGAETN
jgi:polyphosphate kinase